MCIRIPAAIVSIAGHYCHTAVVRCGICAAAHILQCSGTIVVSADTVAVQFHGTAQIVDRLCVVAQQQSLLARRQLVHQLLLFRIQHPCTGCQRLGQKGHAQCQRRKRCFFPWLGSIYTHLPQLSSQLADFSTVHESRFRQFVTFPSKSKGSPPYSREPKCVYRFAGAVFSCSSSSSRGVM